MTKQSPEKNRSRLRNLALMSGLVTEQQLDEAEKEVLGSASGPPTPIVEVTDQMLAEKLVEKNYLSQYQADQLREGRTKFDLGPYVITDFIGQGGMGHVFKATHKMMGRECAVKVLPLSKSTPEAIDSFAREIRTQAQLDNHHLVRAYDAGHDGKVYYLVTEYVPGTDLRRLVRSQGALTIQQAASVIMQAAKGLQHAHQRGLIHRDVKPGNILVTPEGVAKVSDLGLAGCTNDAENDPRAGKIVGTADYLSPEQIKTPLEITPASDIYSLGCTLYYAITGKVPFPGGTAGEKARRHCEETPWHPRRFNPEISEEFVEVIADLMEKDPESRIQSAAEVAERLETWAMDASPIPSHQLSRSPWMPPPVPGVEETLRGDQDTDDVGIGDLSPSDASGSQMSQGTEPVANQETRRLPSGRRLPPPLNLTDERPFSSRSRSRLSQGTLVALTLLFSVPLSMLVGGVLAYLLIKLFS